MLGFLSEVTWFLSLTGDFPEGDSIQETSSIPLINRSCCQSKNLASPHNDVICDLLTVKAA